MGPPPPSQSLLVLRIFLCFLLPAILSTNCIQDGNIQGSLGWIKYFVVLSCLLGLESLLDQCSILRTKPWVATSYRLLKLGLIVWCLAPTQYNGSELTYTHVLAPVFQLTKDLVLYLTDVTPCVCGKLLDQTMTGFQVLGQCVQTGAEYSLTGAQIVLSAMLHYASLAAGYSFTGAQIVLSAISHYSSLAAGYSLTGAQIVLSAISHYASVAAGQFLTGAEIVLSTMLKRLSLAIEYSKHAAQSCAEYTVIVLGKVCQYSEQAYTLLTLLLKSISSETSKICKIFGEILARIFCTAICGLTSFVRKLGEVSKAMLLVSLDLVTKARSTGEEYRVMSGLLRGGKGGDQPRRLISDWFREHSAVIG